MYPPILSSHFFHIILYFLFCWKLLPWYQYLGRYKDDRRFFISWFIKYVGNSDSSLIIYCNSILILGKECDVGVKLIKVYENILDFFRLSQVNVGDFGLVTAFAEGVEEEDSDALGTIDDFGLVSRDGTLENLLMWHLSMLLLWCFCIICSFLNVIVLSK